MECIYHSILFLFIYFYTSGPPFPQELRSGGKRREVTRVRGKIAYYLSKDAGISMAEIARHLGVGTSAIGMTIGRKEAREK